jgi:hypothetical protein
MALLTLALFLAALRVELVDEVYTIPPTEWRYVQVSLRQTPVVVHCNFQSLTKGANVRVALLTQDEMEKLRANQPHGFLVKSQPAAVGALAYQLHRGGEYAIVVDNREMQGPLRVHLRVWLDFSSGGPQGVGYLPPERRLAVILISFAVFFAIVTWSVRKLLQATRR